MVKSVGLWKRFVEQLYVYGVDGRRPYALRRRTIVTVTTDHDEAKTIDRRFYNIV